MRKIGLAFIFRLPELYDRALRLVAEEAGMTPSEYMREKVVETYLQQRARERTVPQSWNTVAQFSRHVKECLDLAIGVPIASKGTHCNTVRKHRITVQPLCERVP